MTIDCFLSQTEYATINYQILEKISSINVVKKMITTLIDLEASIKHVEFISHFMEEAKIVMIRNNLMDFQYYVYTFTVAGFNNRPQAIIDKFNEKFNKYEY